MKRILLMMLALTYVAAGVSAQSVESDNRVKIEGCRVYEIGVSEDTETYDINEKLSDAESHVGKNTRGLVNDLFFSYRGALSKRAVSTVDMLIDASIVEIAELVRNHRKDWMEAVNKECSFSENFNMNQEISDFYYENPLKAISFRSIAPSDDIS